MTSIEKANKNFCTVRNMIDPVAHPEAYRVMHFVPMWFFFDIETEQQAAQKMKNTF